MRKQTQLSLLEEIDREATEQAVETALEKYRYFLLSQPEEQLPKVTQTYSLVPPSNTNSFHSSTEEAAIQNADREKYRHEYLKKVQMAVNRLGYKERALIIRRYMTSDEIYAYQVYNELNMSQRDYYRVRSSAFYKLAFALRMEVYKESEVMSS